MTQLIFSGGTGRSGTTIVGKLLAKHPDIRGGLPYEVRFINDRFGLLDLCFGIEDHENFWKKASTSLYINHLSPRNRTLLIKKFEERFRGKWWERKNRIGEISGLHRSISLRDREEILRIFRRQFPRDHIQASRNFLSDFLNRQRHNQGEKSWVDTTPLNISVSDRIYLLLPQAKFIHMKRDGRDTVASVLRENWGPKNSQAALRWWEHRMAISLCALRAIPASQVLEMNLEDFVVRDRETNYARLLDFVGVDDSQVMRDFFDRNMPSDRVHIGKYRNEIPDWKKLDKAYEASLERLEKLF
jgi:hypothetical protein